MLEKISSAVSGEKAGGGTEAGLFIPLPKNLASQFPSLGEDDKSPPHVTFIYVGACPPDKTPLFLKICRETLGKFNRPVRAKLEPFDYFVHPDKGRRVAYIPVRFDQDMGKLKELLRENLTEAGFDVLDSWPIYRPHVTLKYLGDMESPYKGKVPFGVWVFDTVEVWGLPKVHTISFIKKAEKTASKYLEKIENGDSKPIYHYSDQHLKKREEGKAGQVQHSRAIRPSLSRKVRKDLSSEDPKVSMPALAVACIDRTYERVGNEGSAKEGRFGVTGWKKKHISFRGDVATLEYVGKSKVKQKKEIKDAAIVKVLKKLSRGKAPSDFLFSWKTPEGEEKRLNAREVNSYLEPFKITAKDLRGFHANREMAIRLKAKRKEGGVLPKDPEERKKALQKEFKEALKEASEIVGHEPSTLKNQYLVPGFEDRYLEKGLVLNRLLKKKAKKTHTEKEDEAIRLVVQKHPDVKPSRKDLKKRRVKEGDPDLSEEDRDLSLNYKKVAKKVQSFPYNFPIILRKTRERLRGGSKVPYIKIATQKKGSYLNVNGEGFVGPFKKYSNALRVIKGHLEGDPSTVILGESFSIGPNVSPDSLTKSSHCIMDLDGDVVVEGDNAFNLLANYHEDFFKSAAERGNELPVRSFEEVTSVLDKVASLFEHHHQFLGINQKVAHDFAKRCDVLSILLEEKAKGHSKMQHFARVIQKDSDEAYMTKFNDVKGPLEQDPDEAFMRDEYTGQEAHELQDIEKRASFWEAIEAGPRSREHREFQKLAMNDFPGTSAERYWDRPSGALVSDPDEPYMRENFTEQEWQELQDLEIPKHRGKEFDQEMSRGEFQVDWK